MNTLKIAMLGSLVVVLAGCGTQSLVSMNPATSTVTTVSSSVELVDARPVVDTSYFNAQLGVENSEMTSVDCADLVPLNSDEADETSVFKDESIGLEMVLPYNQKWGTTEKRLAPYEVSAHDKNMIGFGPAVEFGEGSCGWVRNFVLRVVPKRDKAGLVAGLKADKTISNESDLLSFKEESFSGKKVMVYEYDGLCSHTNFEVVGIKHNYVLSTFCSDDIGQAATVIEVIKTLKFI